MPLKSVIGNHHLSVTGRSWGILTRSIFVSHEKFCFSAARKTRPLHCYICGSLRLRSGQVKSHSM
jgi:hypothetical protein